MVPIPVDIFGGKPKRLVSDPRASRCSDPLRTSLFVSCDIQSAALRDGGGDIISADDIGWFGVFSVL